MRSAISSTFYDQIAKDKSTLGRGTFSLYETNRGKDCIVKTPRTLLFREYEKLGLLPMEYESRLIKDFAIVIPLGSHGLLSAING